MNKTWLELETYNSLLENEIEQLELKLLEKKCTDKDVEYKEKIKLEQENQDLKENYERIYNENCILREKHNINDIGLLDENYKLKQVIDEAIEYINKLHSYPMLTKYNSLELLEILRGEDSL